MTLPSRSLRTHLLMLYVLLAGLCGIVVPVLGMRLGLESFRASQIQRQQDDLDALGESLTRLYEEDGKWDRRRVMDILRPAPQWAGMIIALRDMKDDSVFTLAPMPMGGSSRRGGHGGNHMPPGPEPGLPVKHRVIELRGETGKLGTLDVQYMSPPSRFEQIFVSYLAHRMLIGGLVMIAVACGLGFFVAAGLSRPVVRALERTRRISRGDYEPEPVSPTGIREMDALSHGVEELGRSLAGQEKLRRRLMTDIAHELRTPLTVAQTQLEAIADGVLDATPERLTACVFEMQRLGGLIEDVESLTRLEGDALALRPEETDMASFLGPVLDAFQPLFERGGVALERKLTAGLTAEIDADRFRHVIDNLLSNALRYTPSGGRVEVRLFKENNSVVIEVQDTGIGIAPSDLPHVFERFYRADESRARVTGGRGVGLAIAKAAVEAHGGSISVASEQGRGTCFTVRLP